MVIARAVLYGATTLREVAGGMRRSGVVRLKVIS
jgi:hypothetical protein